jgi:hypothetical protein
MMSCFALLQQIRKPTLVKHAPEPETRVIVRPAVELSYVTQGINANEIIDAVVPPGAQKVLTASAC